MRRLHALFMIVFAVAAILQYNDPDPVRWAALYGAAAALATQAWLRGPPHPVIPLLLAAVCAVWMVTLAGGMADFIRHGEWSLLAATMQAGQPMIEEAREFLGLGIVLLYAARVTLQRKPA